MGCQEWYGSLQEGLDSLARDCVHRVPSPFGYSICQTADSTVMEFGDEDRRVL